MARHGSLAEQLSALRAFVQHPDHEPEPVQTNWTTVAANDNNPEDYTDLHTERRVSIRPTIGEIMRSVKVGDVERGQTSEIALLVDKHEKVCEVQGPIVRIGKLKFSDGTQTERCMMAGIDGEPIVGQIRMPTGALLGSKELQERTLGGNGASSGESNAWFSDVFGVERRAYVACGKKRKGRVYSRDEAASMLAKAIANTPVLPPVKRLPDGIAMGTQRIADNFIGMKKSPKGNGGAVAWQDLSDKIAEREAFLEAERELSEKDRSIVETIKTAKSMAEVGQAAGYKGRSAFRHGKKALRAANDNIMKAIAKISA